MNAGRYAKAVCRRAIHLSPKHPKGRWGLGGIALAQGRPDQVVAALPARTTERDAVIDQALLQLLRAQPAQALKTLESGIGLVLAKRTGKPCCQPLPMPEPVCAAAARPRAEA